MGRNFDIHYTYDEIFVDDQCCENCAKNGLECPMDIDKEETNICKIRANEKLRREDAVLRDEELMWCIYWEQLSRR